MARNELMLSIRAAGPTTDVLKHAKNAGDQLVSAAFEFFLTRPPIR